MSPLPILYSFRRCPYAIRARLALCSAGICCELREVLLARKPAEMLLLSSKGTVPVLKLPDGRVIDESFEVMLWALSQHDPEDLLEIDLEDLRYLVWRNDEDFKPQLDRYKYYTRHPAQPRSDYLAAAEVWLDELEQRLQKQPFVSSERLSLADIALFPFIRQFAHSDLRWFQACRYSQLREWMFRLEQSKQFESVMHKYPVWEMGTVGVNFN